MDRHDAGAQIVPIYHNCIKSTGINLYSDLQYDSHYYQLEADE